MRWARLQVLRRDLEGTWVAGLGGARKGDGEWKDLCGLCGGEENGQGSGGLWGLRLGIMGRVGGDGAGIEIDGSGGESDDSETEGGRESAILSPSAKWVTEGLLQMISLRWLEIEIEDEEIPKDQKVQFCLSLGRKLSEIFHRKVDVIYVEKIVEEVTEKKEVVVRGEPGDDSIWGLDS